MIFQVLESRALQVGLSDSSSKKKEKEVACVARPQKA